MLFIFIATLLVSQKTLAFCHNHPTSARPSTIANRRHQIGDAPFLPVKQSSLSGNSLQNPNNNWPERRRVSRYDTGSGTSTTANFASADEQNIAEEESRSLDTIATTSITTTNNNVDPESRLHAALASHTTSTSPLLGTKSIGIDYGLVRTGLAATIGYDFRPLRIVSNLNNTELCQEIIATVRNEGAQRIVVGLPLHKNGTESLRSNITRSFADELSAACLSNFGPNNDVFGGVYLWDERYTSKEAKARIMSNPNSNVQSGDALDGTIDAEAACLILEHYYRNSGLDAELVEVPEGELRGECLKAWGVEKERQERAKEEIVRKRDEALNARQAMMARVKEMEAEMGVSNSGGKKKGKKKKKRKKK